MEGKHFLPKLNCLLLSVRLSLTSFSFFSQGIELQLKHVKAAGVHGLSSFSRIFMNEWLHDIVQNQLFKFVQGAGPIRPLHAMGSGVAKLVVSPAQHY